MFGSGLLALFVSFEQARVDQVIKAEVHLVTSEFVLVLLKGHAVGRIAFLPAKLVS